MRKIIGISGIVAVTGAMLAAGLAPAYADTGTAGTASATITAGSLSVGSIGDMDPLAPTLGGTASGPLPSAQWSDDTGSAAGWAGTLAISPLSYTGTWAKGGTSTALTSTAAGTYSDMQDGVSYKVTVTGTPSGTTTPFSYTSNATGDLSGTGSATNGDVTAVGTKGLKITFNLSVPYTAGDTYTVLAGTQSATGLAVKTDSATAVSLHGTTSTAPVYANDETVLAPGSAIGTVNSGGAVQVLDAPALTGASGTGYYIAAPGVTITADGNSWAKTYSANLMYTITTGP
jgi:hypothetical protein